MTLINRAALAAALANYAVAADTPATITGAVTLAAVANARYTYLLGSGAAPNLPTAVGNTSRYVLKNITGGNISLTTTSSQTVDGGATPLTIGPYASLSLTSDNTNWWVI